jgi:hypothetical protein
MGTGRFLRFGLFIYECFRVFPLMGVFITLQAHESTATPWLIYAAPCALFPLMALFLWLDLTRYQNYLPLLLAGKCVSVTVLLVWFIISRQVTMIKDLSNSVVFIELILIGGDLLSIAAVLLIVKSVRKAAETPVLEETASVQGADMEEK